jgi:diguanylate cyclase (GGDEF)-like protein
MSKAKEISVLKASNLLVLFLFFFGIIISFVGLIFSIEFMVVDPSKQIIKPVETYQEQVRMLGRQKNLLTVAPYKIELYKSVVSTEKYLLAVPVVILSMIMVWIMGISRTIMVNDLLSRIKQVRRVILQERQRKKDTLLQLEKMEEHFHGIHEQLTEGFLVINKDERFHHLNRIAVQFLAKWNKTPKSVRHYLQQPVEAFISDYHTSGLSLCVQDAISKKLSWQKELNFENIQRWIQVRVYPTGADTAYVYMRDITADKTPENLRKMGDSIMTSLSETSPFAIAVMDRQWNYLMVTKQWKKAFSLKEDNLVGYNHKSILPKFPGKWPALEGQLVEGKTVRSEGSLLQVNAKDELVEWEISPWGTGDKIQGFVMYASIITDLHHDKEKIEQQREREHKLAYHDILTGLPNRQLFYDRLTMALAHAYRNLGKVGLLFLDLDGFKGINDTLGHDVGDMLLKEVAVRLKKCVRDTDTVARLGGDEFTVILNGVTSEEDAAHIAEKIIKNINEVFKLGEHDVYVSTSIGISMYPVDGSTSSDLMKKADTAMYWSKESGKNQANFYTIELDGQRLENTGNKSDISKKPENLSQRELESHIRTALQKEEMEVYLQPVMNLNSRSVQSVESLVRWNHPQVGLLQPRQFLTIAENTGMILPIGEFILESIAKKAKKWQELSREEIKFSMNLSMRQLQDENLTQRVERIFKKNNIPASWLILEVSEKLIVDADESILNTLRQLSEKGFLIYVDDLGESYTSLQQLEGISIAGFKVQSQIVQNAMNSNEDKNTLVSLHKLAEKMEVNIIAKGVETEDLLVFLKNVGIQNVQGFVLGKPNKPEKITELF